MTPKVGPASATLVAFYALNETFVFSPYSTKEVSVRPRVKELAEAMFQSKTPLHEQPMSLDLKDSVTRLR